MIKVIFIVFLIMLLIIYKNKKNNKAKKNKTYQNITSIQKNKNINFPFFQISVAEIEPKASPDSNLFICTQDQHLQRRCIWKKNKNN